MPRAETLLKTYREKRDFTKTAEPKGKTASRAKKGIFVVQKHDATRLHYDFRLELDGVLKSWAVTKGPSTNPSDKRLAVRVEDHPLDYGDFEGTIPEGEYGGGTVMLWDTGTWEPMGDPHEMLEKGDLKFRLKGKRMKGEWVLVHMKGRDADRKDGGKRENWLLIKHRDDYATEHDGLTEEFTTSVETGRDLEGIAKGNKPKRKAAKLEASAKVWTSGKAVPLPEFRPPQLATLVDSVPTGDGWIFEMKYDGYRCLASVAGPEVRLFTRTGQDWTDRFSVIQEPLSRVTKGSALIDGELCAFNDKGRTDFSSLTDALTSKRPLVYFVFDLLEQDGQDLSRQPLIERKKRLKKLLGKIGKDSPIQYSDHIEGNGQKVYDAICRDGFEGIIAKKADAPYRNERTKTWLKVKCSRRQEFVIGGWRPSDKKDKTFASLLLGTWEGGKLIYRGRVGTGFNAQSSAELKAALEARARKSSPFETVPRDISRAAKWVSPELVAEIAFTEYTPDGILRHPSFIGLREDKAARDIKLEKAVPASPKAATKTEKLVLSDEAGIAAAERVGVKLTHPERVVFPDQGVTKAEIVAYYDAVKDRMLPFIADRPLSLLRCPQGPMKHCFFQKHDTGGFPKAMKAFPIAEKDGGTESYFYIDSFEGLAAGSQMNVLEWHLWGSRRDMVEKPERVIFDLDPDEGLGFAEVRSAAVDIRDELKAWGLETFAMLSGGKGVHVIAPLTRRTEWPDVKAFCKTFTQRLADRQPDRFTAVLSKEKRKGKLFIDYLRNERGSTAISPWSIRSRQGAPCAVPIGWDELETIEAANAFSLEAAAARAKLPDPWKDYFSLTQSITKAMVSAVAGEAPGKKK